MQMMSNMHSFCILQSQNVWKMHYFYLFISTVFHTVFNNISNLLYGGKKTEISATSTRQYLIVLAVEIVIIFIVI